MYWPNRPTFQKPFFRTVSVFKSFPFYFKVDQL